MTDAHGVPLVIQTVPANQHDSTTLLPLVVEIPAVAGKPGRPKRKPQTLVADKAFDCEALHGLLRWLGIQPSIPKRRTDEQGLGTSRWPMERTISWLHQFRRLRIRWDRCPDRHQVFLTLAATVIRYRIWNKESSFCPQALKKRSLDQYVGSAFRSSVLGNQSYQLIRQSLR